MLIILVRLESGVLKEKSFHYCGRRNNRKTEIQKSQFSRPSRRSTLHRGAGRRVSAALHYRHLRAHSFHKASLSAAVGTVSYGLQKQFREASRCGYFGVSKYLCGNRSVTSVRKNRKKKWRSGMKMTSAGPHVSLIESCSPQCAVLKIRRISPNSFLLHRILWRSFYFWFC